MFNVASSRITSSAHCFSMLLWTLLCGGKCGHHGIAMGHHERLTNRRWADDLMLYPGCRIKKKQLRIKKNYIRRDQPQIFSGSKKIILHENSTGSVSLRSWQDQKKLLDPDLWPNATLKIAHSFGQAHIPSSKCTNHTMLGPLLEVRRSKRRMPL